MATASDGSNAGAGAAGAGAAGAGAAGSGASDADKGSAALGGQAGAGAAAGADKGAAGAAGLGAGAAGAGGEADKAKAAADAAAAAGAQAPVDFKLPEGFDAKDPAVAKVKELATGGKFSPEQTQLVADFLLKSPELKTLREVEQLTRDYQAELKGRVDSLRADPEIGGAKLEASLKVANSALSRFAGSQEALGRLNKLFEAKGISNDPDVVRLFVNAGKAVSEDSMAGSTGTNGAKAPTTMSQLAKSLYGEDHTKAN